MSTDIKSAVQDRYGAVARSKLSTASPGVARVAHAFGYSPEELASIPASANMGLSCGNPTATASLKPGEVVVDLGSGGGLDVFLAAKKVGPTGKAIGIDMTADMVERARRGAQEAGLSNVDFHLAEIESLPLESASVDCMISNCVLNLVPDKARAFAEIFRVLKPGGRLAVSDIALKQPLPNEVSENLLAYIGCVAGAIEIDDYREKLAAAGFADIVIIDTGADLTAYTAVESTSGCCSGPRETSALPVVDASCCGGASQSTVHDELADLMRRYDVNAYAASVKVFAVKPA
ncbi:MAG: arsenite methyltransferase [Pirellulales bacterium]|nr:arsenite methyltransferase [Pirellulales bacterium]